MTNPLLTIEHVPAGQDATRAHVGDLVFVHRPGLITALIRVGQWLRPSLRPWARYTHVAVLVGASGMIIEAHAKGVQVADLTEYRDRDYILVRTGLQGYDVLQAEQFLFRQVGERYGFVIFAGTALRMLTPGRGLWLGMNGTEICSGLAAQALERGWYVFSKLAASLCPAELARELGVPYAG